MMPQHGFHHSPQLMQRQQNEHILEAVRRLTHAHLCTYQSMQMFVCVRGKQETLSFRKCFLLQWWP